MHQIRTLFVGALLSSTSLTLSAAGLEVGDPYVRAVPPGQPNSAAFMRLHNPGTEARALIGAESPAAETVELHTHVEQNGMLRMRRLERIAVNAGETKTLAPGGLHLMLIGLKSELTPGQRIELTLIQDDGERLVIQAPVRRIESMPPAM
ncbi:copper chaperone PCu(A)C [Thermochromatium tepidum]|uniref:Copper chaperone PCu(A)C n=1 Tax=Thermochromatium tepidum ATCC 43061 TaxID=316276 RepID=A0A6I6EEL7_THETI|nr:copper chaperone PCu(A)C [Thermochromatium tepidum]QGU33429.1 copper chaperone PCu(A)C [Thermochromatium tepidum ATCC 43061]